MRSRLHVPFSMINNTILSSYVHTLKIYAWDKCSASLVKIEWLSVHIIKEPTKKLKVLRIAQYWVLTQGKLKGLQIAHY